MQPLSAKSVLDAWEGGQGRTRTNRALALLDAAYPQLTWLELAELPIGRRDQHLLELREKAFGSTLDCLATCPECSETLEFNLNTKDLHATSSPPDDEITDLQLDYEGLNLRYRLPNSDDLIEIEAIGRVDDAKRLLAKRCLLKAQRKEDRVNAAALSGATVSALADAMAGADPLADLLFDLACPHCGHAWREQFDIAGYFLDELTVHATRILEEVDTLARAYGWREADILAMSAWRRQAYMEMLSG